MPTQKPIITSVFSFRKAPILLFHTLSKFLILKLIILILICYSHIEGIAQIAVLDTIIVDSTSINIYYTNNGEGNVYVTALFYDESKQWQSIYKYPENVVLGDTGTIEGPTKKKITWTINNSNVFEGTKLDIKLLSGIYVEGKNFQNTDIKDFIIGQFEVSNKEYCAFLNANLTKDVSKWYKLKAKGSAILKNEEAYFIENGEENYPVVNVTWHGTKAYCDWIGGKLPTKKEWEYVATNKGECTTNYFVECNPFPFPGIDTTLNQIDYYRNKLISNNSIYQFDRNVSEWIEDCYNNNCNVRLVKGGNFRDKEEAYKINSQSIETINTVKETIGFRILWLMK